MSPLFPLSPAARAVAILAGSIAPFSCTLAQQSVNQLDNIVVTASGFEQAVQDAPASISVPRQTSFTFFSGRLRTGLPVAA